MIEFILATWLNVAGEWEPYQLTQPQKDWFRDAGSPRSGKSGCCNQADGHPTTWETRNGKYWTQINGEMVEVPDDALIEGPSPVAQPTVWYRMDYDATVGRLVPWIRCFWPGTGL